MCVSSSYKLLSGEYATSETETTVSCIDHLSTNSCNETNCSFLIKCDLTGHHGLRHITSYVLKSNVAYNIRFQRDLTKVNDAPFVCLFHLRQHSDLKKIAYEKQSIEKVANDKVSKLRTIIGRNFPMKQVTKQQQRLKIARNIENVIKK